MRPNAPISFFLSPLLAAATLAFVSEAGAVGVTGKGLVLVSGSGRPSSLSVVLRGAGITKGPDAPAHMPAGLDATLEIYSTDDPLSFLGKWILPDPWRRNSRKGALFVNRDAPAGSSTVRRALIRPGKTATVVAAGLGDGGVLADVTGTAPSATGGITVVLTIHNALDGSTHRMCTRFATAAGSKLGVRSTRRGRRLTARRGVPADCPPEIVLHHSAACETLNEASCLLPYPSTHFLVPASTPTGFALRIPQEGLPQVKGDPVQASFLSGLDGFSPASQILMNFPQGVDPALSNAARLLPPECCGQPAGPPWIDTRTITERSLEPDSPSVLLDADTGERVLHFIEPDARAVGKPERQILFLRPGSMLAPGHRYIVAMRNLVAPDGAAVVAEPAFAVLRDGVRTPIAAIETRRAYMESEIFAPLAAAGIARADLLLAFDFVVASDHQHTFQMLAMRDQAYDWLDTVAADPAAVPFENVEITSENDCQTPGTFVWRDIRGTFDSPLFLTAEPTDSNAPFLNVVDGDHITGTPAQNGFTHPEFTVSIPCTALDPEQDTRQILFGHGLGQVGSFMTSTIPAVVNRVVPWNGLAAATDWRGLSGQDLVWVGTNIIGIGQSRLNDFPAFPARLRQGMLNTLVLARLMKLGLFNRDPAFRRPDGSGVFPGPTADLNYYGISLGGIMGTYLAGLTPDIERFGLDVPSVNFSCLLQRANPFAAFDGLLSSIGITDPLDAALGIQLTHELWVGGEPASVARHITSDPLPGSGGPKKILYTAAWLDKQVSNQCTEIAARTLGLPNLSGSIQQGLVGIPDLPGPLDSAYVVWDLGELDILNPAHAPHIPPLANLIPDAVCDPHPRRPTIADAIRQLTDFLRPGGQIQNFCSGLCDADVPDERPLGPCQP